MTARFRRTALLAAAGVAAGGAAQLAAAPATQSPIATSCHWRSEARGERSCATERNIWFARYRRVSGRSYGAIAYSTSTDAHGFSYNYASRAQAEVAALGHCRDFGGDAANCKVVVWFYDRCAALATGDNGAHGWAHHSWRQTAADNALANCWSIGGANCRIVREVCSPI